MRLGHADDPLHVRARGILRAMIAATRPGLHCRELWQIVDANRSEFALHPLAKTVLGSSIGLPSTVLSRSAIAAAGSSHVTFSGPAARKSSTISG